MNETKGALDLMESAAGVAPAGQVRVKCSGGVLSVSANGGDYAAVATGSTTVSTDASLSGDGSSGSPLSVVSAPTATTATTATTANAVAAGAVSTAGLADGAVTSAKMAAGAALHGWTRVAITGAATDNITISGLNGDADDCYEIFCYTVNANAAASTVTMKPNGLTTNQSLVQTFSDASTVATAAGSSFDVGFAGATADGFFRLKLFSRTGTKRGFDGYYESMNSSSVITFYSNYTGRWNDSATNITSLQFVSNRADGFGVGSYLLWRKLPVGT